MEDISPTSPALFSDVWNTSSPAPGGRPTVDPFSLQFFRVSQHLQRICPPIILCVGTLGNVMTVVIMRRLTSEDTTINIYFTAIAIVDLMYLWTIVLNQVVQYNFGYDFKTLHGVFCKVFTWLYTGGGTVSAWYLVCMTVHRAMSVAWPHRVNSLCTRRTVLLMLTAVTAVIALLYCHYLVGLDTLTLSDGVTYRCTMATQDYVRFHSNIFVYVEVLIYSALPFITLLISNSVLTWRLVASAKRANRTLTEGSSAQAHVRERAANSVTLTVMAVSLTFLVLTLPSAINFTIGHLVYIGHSQTSLSELLRTLAVTYICTLLSHSNHAVNFYLYIVTGRRFRAEFIKILGWGRGLPRLPAGAGKGSNSG